MGIQAMKPRFLPLALVAFVGMTSVNWSPEEAGIQLSNPEALKQHGTEPVAVTDQAMPPGKNVLWCATFQMAWDGAAEHFGRPLLLKPACPLADALNRKPFDRRWVDEASVFTASGQVDEGVLDRIDQGHRKLAGEASKFADDMRKSLQPSDLVFYAALHKQLEFSQPFGKLGNWQVGEKKVPWFGFTPEATNADPLRKQVKVHHYADKNDFVIELGSKQEGDQLLLAKLPKAPETLEAMSRGILGHLNAAAPVAGEVDLLAIPNLAADLVTEFSDLHGKTVGGSGRFIRQARQSIRLVMDEKGVKLDSEAKVSFGCSKVSHVEPRLMILDPPFAIVMKRKDAPQPYFVAWMANADLLEGK